MLRRRRTFVSLCREILAAMAPSCSSACGIPGRNEEYLNGKQNQSVSFTFALASLLYYRRLFSTGLANSFNTSVGNHQVQKPQAILSKLPPLESTFADS